jgi:hypothetical protein
MHHSSHKLDIVLKVEEKGEVKDERGAWRGFDPSGLREMDLYRRREKWG